MAGRQSTRSTKQQQKPTLDSSRFAGLELLGGRVCLDFINTIDPRRESQPEGARPRDYLEDYADLVLWSEYARLLSAPRAAALLATAAKHPDLAQQVFERAIALRELLYRVFSAAADGKQPAATDLEALRSAYRKVMAEASLVYSPDGFTWHWPDTDDALDQMLWPLARSAIELLTASELRRVKVCPGLDDCGWLFLDTSKSGQRRWCSMDSCGSRAKMRRYYARSHSGGHSAGTPG
jgi:predicted RNA-binding Zn ribbon-like protein